MNTPAVRYVALYEMMPFDRALLVKAGAPSALVATLAMELGISQVRLCRMLGITLTALRRKNDRQAVLPSVATERLVGLCRLVGQIELIVQESGHSEGFDPAKWFGQWLGNPVAALGGRRPEDLIDVSDGRTVVADLLGQMKSGAYA